MKVIGTWSDSTAVRVPVLHAIHPWYLTQNDPPRTHQESSLSITVLRGHSWQSLGRTLSCMLGIQPSLLHARKVYGSVLWAVSLRQLCFLFVHKNVKEPLKWKVIFYRVMLNVPFAAANVSCLWSMLMLLQQIYFFWFSSDQWYHAGSHRE